MVVTKGLGDLFGTDWTWDIVLCRVTVGGKFCRKDTLLHETQDFPISCFLANPVLEKCRTHIDFVTDLHHRRRCLSSTQESGPDQESLKSTVHVYIWIIRVCGGRSSVVKTWIDWNRWTTRQILHNLDGVVITMPLFRVTRYKEDEGYRCMRLSDCLVVYKIPNVQSHQLFESDKHIFDYILDDPTW